MSLDECSNDLWNQINIKFLSKCNKDHWLKNSLKYLQWDRPFSYFFLSSFFSLRVWWWWEKKKKKNENETRPWAEEANRQSKSINWEWEEKEKIYFQHQTFSVWIWCIAGGVWWRKWKMLSTDLFHLLFKKKNEKFSMLCKSLIKTYT